MRRKSTCNYNGHGVHLPPSQAADNNNIHQVVQSKNKLELSQFLIRRARKGETSSSPAVITSSSVVIEGTRTYK